MLKPKVVKLILEELNLKYGDAFYIEGEEHPYRFKKNGELERFVGQTWGATSYSYLDIIVLSDEDRIKKTEETFIEYSPKGKKK